MNDRARLLADAFKQPPVIVRVVVRVDVIDRQAPDEGVVEHQRADERRVQRELAGDAGRFEADLRIRVDERAAIPRDPAREPLADLDRRVQQLRRVDARGEPALERFLIGLLQEQRTPGPRDDLRQLRRDERHRVGDAEAGAHRLRHLVKRVDLAMRERDVLERAVAARGHDSRRGRSCRRGFEVGELAARCFRTERREERRQDVDEDRHEPRVEGASRLVAELFDRALGAERLVVRPVGRHRVVVVADRQDARADRNIVTGEPVRIAFAVPPFVVAHDERRDRIRERHGRDDLGADLRVHPDFLELFLRERPSLREDVLRHGELPDILQQRRGLHALDVVIREAGGARESGGVYLHARKVHPPRMFFRVDRARERLDGRQMQIGGPQHIGPLVVDASHVDLVSAVHEIQRRERERGDPISGVRDERPE